MMSGSYFSIEVECVLVLHVFVEFFLSSSFFLLLIIPFLGCLVCLSNQVYINDPKDLDKSSKGQLYTIKIDDGCTQRSRLKIKLDILILVSL